MSEVTLEKLLADFEAAWSEFEGDDEMLGSRSVDERWADFDAVINAQAFNPKTKAIAYRVWNTGKIYLIARDQSVNEAMRWKLQTETIGKF